MSFIMHAVPALAAVAASVALYILVVLVMRNPRMPAWVHGEAAAQAVALVMTIGLVVGFAAAAQMLILSGIHVAVAVAATTAAIIGAAFAICHFFHIGERLRNADRGQSPFRPVEDRRDMPVHGARVA
ncbi:MAG: hypothetical protein ACFE0S_08045 [Rhodospirillales bacterium]